MDFGPHSIYDCINAIWNTFAMASRYIIRGEEWTKLVVLQLVIGQTWSSIRPQSALMCRLSQGFWHPCTGPSQQVSALEIQYGTGTVPCCICSMSANGKLKHIHISLSFSCDHPPHAHRSDINRKYPRNTTARMS